MYNIFYIHLIYCFVDAQMSWLSGKKRLFGISQIKIKIWHDYYTCLKELCAAIE